MISISQMCFRLFVAGSVAAALLAVGCDSAPPKTTPARPSDRTRPAQPNIVLITVCTFRYDHLTPAGYPRNTTPFLGSLAAKGVFCENAVSASSWTQPAVASILTGLTPNVHRMTRYHPTGAVTRRQLVPERLLADEIVTLGECLGEAGYATFCRINNVQAGHFFNIPQGFDDGVTNPKLDTEQMLSELAGWLRARPSDQPFFAFLLTRDPHFYYNPRYDYYRRFNRAAVTLSEQQYGEHPRTLHTRIKQLPGNRVAADDRRSYVDLYDAELAQLDDAISRLPGILENAGCASNTVLVVTGDHGEHFFEGGRTGHTWGLDEALVRTPLIFSGPGIPAGVRLTQVVRSIDIYPTLAELAGASTPDVLQGTSLLPLIRGDAHGVPRLTAFASFKRVVGEEQDGSERQIVLHLVRDGRYKLHTNTTGYRLHDLEQDPLELHNLIETQPDVAARLRAELDHWLQAEETMRALIAQGKTRTLTQEMIEELRSLGYVD